MSRDKPLELSCKLSNFNCKWAVAPGLTEIPVHIKEPCRNICKKIRHIVALRFKNKQVECVRIGFLIKWLKAMKDKSGPKHKRLHLIFIRVFHRIVFCFVTKWSHVQVDIWLYLYRTFFVYYLSENVRFPRVSTWKIENDSLFNFCDKMYHLSVLVLNIGSIFVKKKLLWYL